MKRQYIKNILLIFMIFTFILSCIMVKPVNDLDELWNYSFAKNIANGLLPYKEFNIIVTPLLYYISGIILKITSQQLIIMRILAAILNTVIFFMLFKTLNKLINVIKNKIILKENKKQKIKEDKMLQVILTSIIMLIWYNIYTIDYNFGFILIAIIILYLEIKERIQKKELLKIDVKKEIIIGVLLGLALLTKQSSGIILIIASLGYRLLIVRNIDQLKKYFKSILLRILGILIPTTVFLIYLISTDSLVYFLDYAILGILTFQNNIPYTNLINENISIKILMIVVPINILYMFLKGINFKSIVRLKKQNINFNIERTIENDINLILFTYSIGTCILIYPIADKIHFLAASLISIIGLIFNILIFVHKKILVKKLTSKVEKTNKIENKIPVNEIIKIILSTFSISVLVSITCLNIFNYIEFENKSSLNNFKYININENLENEIKEIDSYIVEQNNLGNKVYILDARASIYMLPFDIYNKDYDMFNIGNLGKKGEEGQIEKIENSESNIQYLILSEEYNRNWQNPELVRKYIIDNLTQIGEIGIFDIYSK